MLEIVFVVLIVRGFGRKAEEKNLNAWQWRIIGAFSYLIPEITMAFYGFPTMVENNILSSHNSLVLTTSAIAFSIFAGLAGAALAWFVLMKQDSGKGISDTLDESP